MRASVTTTRRNCARRWERATSRCPAMEQYRRSPGAETAAASRPASAQASASWLGDWVFSRSRTTAYSLISQRPTIASGGHPGPMTAKSWISRSTPPLGPFSRCRRRGERKSPRRRNPCPAFGYLGGLLDGRSPGVPLLRRPTASGSLCFYSSMVFLPVRILRCSCCCAHRDLVTLVSDPCSNLDVLVTRRRDLTDSRLAAAPDHWAREMDRTSWRQGWRRASDHRQHRGAEFEVAGGAARVAAEESAGGRAQAGVRRRTVRPVLPFPGERTLGEVSSARFFPLASN